MTISSESGGLSAESQQSITEEHRILKQKIDLASARIVGFCSSAANRNPSEVSNIANLLQDLIVTAQEHFQHEEAIMTKNEFPGLLFHKRDHEYLLRSLMDFASSLSHETVPVSIDIGVNLRSWLSYHIKKYDEAYVAFMDARGRDAGEGRS
ncbi:MAG: hemerythrin family protein [Rhodomicrobium sp.]